jgi:branched-chain amino acid transport system ATP-binding protein
MKLTGHIAAGGYGQGFVLTDLDLKVESGQIVALLGPNGAGKTSTVAALTGGLPHVVGDVRIDDTPIKRHDPRTSLARGVAHVPEGRGVFATMSVYDNLLVCRRGAKGDDQLLDDLLDRFPILRQRSKQRAGTLSGGEQQMLAIARSLMARPRFLLVDEPSLGLAPVIVDSVFDLLRGMCDDDGLGVLLAEQTQEVMTYADTAYVLANGRMVASGPAKEVAERDLFVLYASEPDLNDIEGADK